VRIAFLTDVHGNLPALEAVLTDIGREGADAVWDGGDAVGYHPWPSECVRLLARTCAVTVMGNYDRKVLKVPRRRRRWLRTKDPLKAATLIWAWDHLAPDARELLARRPSRARPEVPSGPSVLVCHGSPASRKEVLGPATPAARWRELSAAAAADLVLHGHTHVPYTRRDGGTFYANPGSVGRSEDGDPRAAYALVDLERDGAHVQLRRVAYDTERVAREIRAHDLPPVFAAMVVRGLSLPRARRRLDRAHR
jgi:predicted phosphodiesterase